MKLISWIVVSAFALAAIVLAVANRDLVRVSADPLPFEIQVPLYVVGLAAVLLGILIGGVSTWISGRKWRRLARNSRQQVAALELELRRLRSAEAGPPAGTPGRLVPKSNGSGAGESRSRSRSEAASAPPPV